MLELIVLHCLVSLLYAVIQRRKSKQEVLPRLLIVFFLPLIGIILLLVTDTIKMTSDKNENYLKLESDLLKLKEESSLFRRADVSKEMNIVPMEEILLLNDTRIRRKMLIDALKEETIWQIGTLEAALGNDDTETVHYAAAALSEMRRKLQLQLQDLSVKYESNKKDIDVIRAYANVLKKYLESALLDKRTHMKYSFTYSFVLEQLLELDQSDEHAFIEKINCELTNENYEKAKAFCHMFHQHHPNSEHPYVLTMKVHYMLGSYPDLMAELSRLKRSNVKVSHSTLLLIRFWSQRDTAQIESLDSALSETATGSHGW